MGTALKKTRIKAAAQTNVPQTLDAAATDIRQIGDLQRQLMRSTAELNDNIAALTNSYQPVLKTIGEQIKKLQEGVQAFCEANREDLTNGGKVKTANLVTGEVQWRKRPPSVRVTGADAVIETLKRLGLSKFVRSKDEINKEAILNEPDEVKGVAGIKVEKDFEDFVITPFECEVPA